MRFTLIEVKNLLTLRWTAIRLYSEGIDGLNDGSTMLGMGTFCIFSSQTSSSDAEVKSSEDCEFLVLKSSESRISSSDAVNIARSPSSSGRGSTSA